MDKLEACATEYAGNWRKFQSFGWSNQPEKAEDWCIVHTHHRDSTFQELCRVSKVRETLKSLIGDDVREEHMNHWAVGWIDGFSIRVYDEKGRITKAFRAFYRHKKPKKQEEE
jgi:hypothetical protein